MPIDPTTSLDWESTDPDVVALLDNLQANILKGHVRDHLTLFFLHFDDAAQGKAFLTAVHPLVKSAKDHLLEVQAFKQRRLLGEAAPPAPDPITIKSYVGVGLTASGYAKLGKTVPGDARFKQAGGMKGSRAGLADPPISTWDDGYRGDIHAVVLVGDAADRREWQERTRQQVLSLVTDKIRVLAEETGLSQVNHHGDGIEHFGYVDGRSQPLFLTQDVQDERDHSGASVWDPEFPLQQVIVDDPGSADARHFGSYFVFRKLEQNVSLFKRSEQELADRLGLQGDDRERAGAMLVGRFEDGTPVTSYAADGAHGPVPNDFDYDSDGAGAKCPFHGHIRKTNPRGSGGAPGGGPADVAFERSHIMARRGQTYGRRLDDPNGEVEPEDRPTRDVGLLFMAFNASIANQFEFTQAAWANNAGFPFTSPTPAGLDPVIGQGFRDRTVFPTGWGEPSLMTAPTDTAAQAVTMKGGQYFFMPSLAFLGGL